MAKFESVADPLRIENSAKQKAKFSLFIYREYLDSLSRDELELAWATKHEELQALRALIDPQ